MGLVTENRGLLEVLYASPYLPRDSLYMINERQTRNTCQRLIRFMIITGMIPLLLVALVTDLRGASEPQPGTVAVFTDHPENNFTFSPVQSRDPFLRDFIRWTFDDAGNLDSSRPVSFRPPGKN